MISSSTPLSLLDLSSVRPYPFARLRHFNIAGATLFSQQELIPTLFKIGDSYNGTNLTSPLVMATYKAPRRVYCC
ncbi:hypothetical protein M404DRAFT_654455 [Pisolithus tinctorius Marx 270]|uniref:Uncharacterized protein n=1 Tax=Pisolithus tinctorius Marx 270 TaxID=870435 RepID=A0A0C3JYZ4_PISTI|nr:hypothetical protein M404DRAFT_654455 [Pisolithus tinctorius Marx 270]